MDEALLSQLEQIHGIDISFDVKTGVQGTKDVRHTDRDFIYSPSIVALCEELQRLFDLTPKGSLIDDPDYGIDFSFIGQQLDPRVTSALVRLAVLQTLQHSGFRDRFRVNSVDAYWQSEDPNVIRVVGTLEVYGYEDVGLLSFGPYALNNLLLSQVRDR
jgi:hypothetical protein